MENYFHSIIFGITVSLLGFGMAWYARQSGAQYKADGNLSSDERQFLEKQTSRRNMMAYLMVFIGAGIPVLDILADFNKLPVFALVALLSMMLVILWLVVLALRDVLSSRKFRIHTQNRIDSIRIKQKELEQEIDLVRPERFDSES